MKIALQLHFRMMIMTIFDILRNITYDNKSFLDNVSEEDLKVFNPYIILMMLCGAKCDRDYHVYTCAEYMNKYIFSLRDHPKLLYKLFCATNATHNYTYYEFIKNENIHPMPYTIAAIKEYYQYTDKQALDVLNIFDINDIMQLADNLGYSDKQINKLKKELY